jgi:hypothetical protein
MRDTSAKYAAPFFWGNPSVSGIWHNGSCFFLEWTKDAPFGVTAAHVYQTCLADCASSERGVCQLGTGVVINPRERLIDLNNELDIATFHISPEEIRRAEKMAFTMPYFVPQEGKGVFFAGFPGSALERIGNATYNAGIMSGLVVASRVGERNISCQLEREYMVHAPSQPCDMGGMSGAFLAAVIDGGNVSHWQPAGMIYECHDDFEIILASRLDRLDPNGRITS